MGRGWNFHAGRQAYRCSFLLLAASLPASLWIVPGAAGQVFVVDREHLTGVPDFKPTDVPLEGGRITTQSRRQLILAFASEQGFARRPLPLGSRGLTLRANGPLTAPGGYVDSVEKAGVSAKPGDRLLITNFKIESDKIVLEFNGGPDPPHKYLRHLSVGTDPYFTVPVVQDDGVIPTGSRLTLLFDGYVPEMTVDQLRELLRPVIDFDVKTPMEAYTETLPPKLRDAIRSHKVLVGMDRKMVIYALGAPSRKVREGSGASQFEEWIYGDPPQPTQFVRFQNGRVTRLEIAEVGKSPVVRDKDETDGYLRNPNEHDVYMGDARQHAEGDAPPSKPPTLLKPGEKPPDTGLQPVRMPVTPPPPQPIPPPPNAAPGSSLVAAVH
jgi:hypothetical protein